MAKETRREVTGALGPLETEVMQVLWKARRPLAVRDVLDRLNRRRNPALAYTTVMTVLARLAEKQVLQRIKEGRGYVYEPLVTDQAGIAVQSVIRDYGETALAQFVEQARADPKLLARLQRLMSQEQ